MYKIFIVEDDELIRDELKTLLENAGYSAVMTNDFEDVSGQILSSGCDLVLMDINIPGENGETLLRELRKHCRTPVIMVTSRTNEADELISMSFGADDYITKPYNPAILLLRISAVLKRCGSNQQRSYRGFEVNPPKGCLTNGEKEIILTKNEMIIFRELLDSLGEIVTRDRLMTALWDNDEYINDNALTVNISRLRAKLSELGFDDAIETRKKQGYVLK